MGIPQEQADKYLEMFEPDYQERVQQRGERMARDERVCRMLNTGFRDTHREVETWEEICNDEKLKGFQGTCLREVVTLPQWEAFTASVPKDKQDALIRPYDQMLRASHAKQTAGMLEKGFCGEQSINFRVWVSLSDEQRRQVKSRCNHDEAQEGLWKDFYNYVAAEHNERMYELLMAFEEER